MGAVGHRRCSFEEPILRAGKHLHPAVAATNTLGCAFWNNDRLSPGSPSSDISLQAIESGSNHLLRMRIFSGSLLQRDNQPVPSLLPAQSFNQTLNHSEAFVEVSIDGLSGAGTISLTVADNFISANQTGVFGTSQMSMRAPLTDGPPLTQMPPFGNGSAASASTVFMPTGFGTNPIPTLLPIPANATGMASFTGAPEPTASGVSDGSVSLLLVIFRAIFGGA